MESPEESEIGAGISGAHKLCHLRHAPSAVALTITHEIDADDVNHREGATETQIRFWVSNRSNIQERLGPSSECQS